MLYFLSAQNFHGVPSAIDIDEAYNLRWNNPGSEDPAEEQQVESNLPASDQDSDASAPVPTSNAWSGPSNFTPDAIQHAEAVLTHALQRLNALGHTNGE